MCFFLHKTYMHLTNNISTSLPACFVCITCSPDNSPSSAQLRLPSQTAAFYRLHERVLDAQILPQRLRAKVAQRSQRPCIVPPLHLYHTQYHAVLIPGKLMPVHVYTHVVTRYRTQLCEWCVDLNAVSVYCLPVFCIGICI